MFWDVLVFVLGWDALRGGDGDAYDNCGVPRAHLGVFVFRDVLEGDVAGLRCVSFGRELRGLERRGLGRTSPVILVSSGMGMGYGVR